MSVVQCMTIIKMCRMYECICKLNLKEHSIAFCFNSVKVNAAFYCVLVHNTAHKAELRADIKGNRQRTGELTLIFSGMEIDLHDAAQANGDAGRGNNSSFLLAPEPDVSCS
jgi:hypothetical protein